MKKIIAATNFIFLLLASIVNADDIGDTPFKTVSDTLYHSFLMGKDAKAFTGDFNKDGKTDILQVYKKQDKYRSLISNGNGTFTLAYEGFDGVHRTSARKKHIGDWNGDGIPDMLEIPTNTDRLDVFLSKGDGSMLEVWDAQLGFTWSTAKADVYVGDFNGDYCDDFVQIHKSSNKIRLYSSNADGTFTKKWEKTGSEADSLLWRGNKAHSFIGDYNGDGHPDFLQVLIWGNTNTNLLYRVSISQPYTHDFVNIYEGYDGVQEAGARTKYAGDWNGDGITDLLEIHKTLDRLDVFLSNGNGSVTETWDAQFDIVWNDSDAVTLIGDYNGDRCDDILQIHKDDNKARILTSNEDGTFTETWRDDNNSSIEDGTFYKYEIAKKGTFSIDFNGDYLLDVIQIPQKNDEKFRANKNKTY